MLDQPNNPVQFIGAWLYPRILVAILKIVCIQSVQIFVLKDFNTNVLMFKMLMKCYNEGFFFFSFRNYAWFWIPIIAPHVGALLGVWLYDFFIDMPFRNYSLLEEVGKCI